MPQRWTDPWVKALEHPPLGRPEVVFRDPTLNKHRLVVKRTRKVFDVQAEQPAAFNGGRRKTYVVQVGDANDLTVEMARDRAAVILSRIRKGEDPRSRSAEREVTVGGAWEEFKKRDDIRPRTLDVYKQSYESVLKPWADRTLRSLVDEPRLARDEHAKVTKERGPSAADHGLRLLRAVYRHAAQLDTTLPRDRHPCSAVQWHGDKKRQGAAITAAEMPGWFKQVETIRKESPVRASFHVLCLRLGLRPGELARATWTEVDWKRKALAIPESKTVGFEVPLSKQALAELKRLEEARALNKPGCDFVFPTHSESGHLEQLTEKKKRLSKSGNCGRHTFATIAGVLGYDQRLIDILQGRTLIKSGVAGTGYLDRAEFGPVARKA